MAYFPERLQQWVKIMSMVRVFRGKQTDYL